MQDIYRTIMAFMDLGGDVLWWIAALTFMMWILIIERIVYFRTEHVGVIQDATRAWEGRPERKSWSAHQVRERLISEASERITGTLPLIQTLSAALAFWPWFLYLKSILISSVAVLKVARLNVAVSESTLPPLIYLFWSSVMAFAIALKLPNAC